MTRRTWSIGGVVAGVVAVLIFAWSWLYRYNDLEPLAGLLDDHYFYLVRGWQILFGEWPDRDFVDPGAPLTFVVAALVQVVGGRGTWSEIVFCVTALSVATTLTFWSARRASGSTVIAALAAVFQAALWTRFYSYPKVLVYAIALPAIWSYVDRPSIRKLAWLAGLSVAALLFRHDHGLFVGLAVVATIVVQAHVTWMTRVRHLAAYGVFTLMCAAPYLGWLQLNGGIVTHVVTANSWAQRDRSRSPLRVPEFALSPQEGQGVSDDTKAWWRNGVFEQALRNYEPWLFWLIIAVPVAVLVAQTGKPEQRSDWPHARQKLLVASLLGLVLVWGFIRGNLTGRFGDASVTTAILGAWLIRAAVRSVREGRALAVRMTAAAGTLIVLTGTVLVLVPYVRTQLGNAGMLDRPLGAVDKAVEMTARLNTWPLEGWTSPDAPGPIRLAFYVRDCAAENDRVFISPYLPVVHALAQRPFPGGHGDLRPGFFSTPADQALTLARLKRHSVPLAVMPAGGDYEKVSTEMPRIDAWLRTEFNELGDVELGDGSSVKLFARRDRRTAGTWRQTGWPCFR